MQEKDYAAEYLALKAANDQLRERGKNWLLDSLSHLCAEANRRLTLQPDQVGIQTGSQDWQFQVENTTMAGERFGIRYRFRTLTVEVGWPRLPEHGFLTNNAMAHARVSLSQNTMLEPQPIAEMILKKMANNDPVWFAFNHRVPGEQITVGRLNEYLSLILAS